MAGCLIRTEAHVGTLDDGRRVVCHVDFFEPPSGAPKGTRPVERRFFNIEGEGGFRAALACAERAKR